MKSIRLFRLLHPESRPHRNHEPSRVLSTFVLGAMFGVITAIVVLAVVSS